MYVDDQMVETLKQMIDSCDENDLQLAAQIIYNADNMFDLIGPPGLISSRYVWNFGLMGKLGKDRFTKLTPTKSFYNPDNL